MRKVVFLIAIVSALIIISPMAAAENNVMADQVLLGFNPFGNTNDPPFEIENLKILKVNKKHTKSNGNVKKSTKYYLTFNVKATDDSDSMDKFDIKISCLDKNNKTIKTVKSSIDHDGKYKVPLKKVSKIKKAKVTVYNKDGEKAFSKATSKIKVTKKVTKDKAKKKSTSSSSSSSSSDVTYWASSKSGKFHYPSCEWAQKIYGSNKVVFHSREKAINSGYVPCQVCGP